jgi:hypothetical protein
MGRGPISLVLCFLVVTSSASAQAPSPEYCWQVVQQIQQLQQIAFQAASAAITEPDRNIACDLWTEALQAQQSIVAYANPCNRALAISAASTARLYERSVRANCSGFQGFRGR